MSELLEPSETSIASEAIRETTRIARAASIIALGNVASRILGLARDTVKANLFGATGLVSAYEAAAIVPTLLYDLLVGGMVSSALVPVFSEYAQRDRREVWRLASLVITLAVVVLAALALIVELAAPIAARLIGGGLDARLLDQTASLLRVTVIATLFISLSGIIVGLLQALKRFTRPAFSAAIFNAAIVVCALLLGSRYGIASMAIGLFVGAMLQVLLQLPGLRDARLRPAWDLRHPGLRQIGRLYLPVILGLAINQLAIVLSFNLASHANEQGISWMRYATTLIQFPLGLVATAVSIAILPTLSQQSGDNASFRATLARGLKLVLVLIVPATIGLLALARPIVALLFEHGQFTPSDTDSVTRVLLFYLPGLAFAAVDLPLVFAFYARKDTLTPAIVGLISNVAIYLVAALAPSALLKRPLEVADLAFANSVQWISHALIMLWLMKRRVGGLRGLGLRALTLKALAGSAAMGLGTWIVVGALENALGGSSLLHEAVIVGGAALTGV
ncbi:MAG TPA: murein biosynthesis integral membrane protein MurJ, partial [Anaerolineae bacterium]|nr:murein biosynthesis integral membrane protein MurJ [Anaerolineae bacterium]